MALTWGRFIKYALVFRQITPLCWGLISMFWPSAMLELAFWPELATKTMGGNAVALRAIEIVNHFWGGDDWQQAMLLGDERLHWWIAFFAVPHNAYEVWLSQYVLAWCRDTPEAACATWGMWGDFSLHLVLAGSFIMYLYARRRVAFAKPKSPLTLDEEATLLY